MPTHDISNQPFDPDVLEASKLLCKAILRAIANDDHNQARNYANAASTMLSNYLTDNNADIPATFTVPTAAFDTLFTLSEARKRFPSLTAHFDNIEQAARRDIRSTFQECYLSDYRELNRRKEAAENLAKLAEANNTTTETDTGPATKPAADDYALPPIVGNAYTK